MWMAGMVVLIATCDTPPGGMICIEGGPFLRGSNGGPDNERPQASVNVDTFYMDAYEVDVAHYDSCVSAKKCKAAKTNYSDYSRPKQPKVGVKWFDAVQYCSAMGKHLPSEAEWEKAARGIEPVTCERAVIMDERGRRSCGVEKQGGHPEKGRTLEVGSRPPTPAGLYDMAGNAEEWVFDWASTSYAVCGEACSRDNPKGPCDGAASCPGHSERVVRGGSWYWPADHATATHRRFHTPANHPIYHHFGFRCAASEAEARALR